jgi:hypothetical protein
MISHIVLFRPRPDLTADARDAIVAAFESALRDIPSIRGARVGRRILHGRPYEALMKDDFPYAAVIEFDDIAGLTAYLEHPSHEQLATRFFMALEQALIYDFDLKNAAY